MTLEKKYIRDFNHKRSCRAPKSRFVPIDVPPDIEEKAERGVRQLEKYQAACLWCGHGYPEYDRKAEGEHFAYNCPNAPEELRDNAKRRLLVGDDDCCEAEENEGDGAEGRRQY